MDNVPLWPLSCKKGKKRKNIYTGPPQDDAPGARILFDPVTKDPTNVTFHPWMLHLHILPDCPDINLDDRFPNRQRDCDFLTEESNSIGPIQKVGTELPATVDPDFDAKFDKATHGAYL